MTVDGTEPAGMRRSTAVLVATAWGVALGGTFGALLPWLLGYWHVHRPLPGWVVAQVIGAALVVLGMVPIVQAFVAFVRAGGTPVPGWIPRLHGWVPPERSAGRS